MAHPDFRTPEESDQSNQVAKDFLAARIENGIDGIRWESVMDERTTPQCRELDGKEWSYPDFEPRDHNIPFPGFPPIWYNCRSTVFPTYAPDED